MTYIDHKCSSCGKLLFKGILVDSAVEVKCRRCGTMNTFRGVPKERLICALADQCPRRQPVAKYETI